MADLVTQPQLAAALPGISAGQAALLPDLAKSASRAVRRWCNRRFTRQVLDRLHTLPPNGSLVLDEFPVNAVLRLAADPTPVIAIGNADGVANQRAVAALATSGDVDAGQVVTGLSLTRWASGVAIPATIAWADLPAPTVAALAAAVVALGGGWTASVTEPYGLWPVADLRAVQGAMPALGARTAGLLIHVTDLAFDLDERSGIVTFGHPSASPWDDPGWGPATGSDFGAGGGRGTAQGLRVVYDAGFDVVPEDVQQATIETVADMLNTLQTDQRISSESDGEYSYTRDTAFADYGLTKSALGKLAPYRNTRV